MKTIVLAVLRHLRCADVLRDAAGFAIRHVGVDRMASSSDVLP